MNWTMLIGLVALMFAFSLALYVSSVVFNSVYNMENQAISNMTSIGKLLNNTLPHKVRTSTVNYAINYENTYMNFIDESLIILLILSILAMLLYRKTT